MQHTEVMCTLDSRMCCMAADTSIVVDISPWSAPCCSTMLQAPLQHVAPLKLTFNIANSVWASKPTSRACTQRLHFSCNLKAHQSTHACMPALQTLPFASVSSLRSLRKIVVWSCKQPGNVAEHHKPDIEAS